MHVSALQRVPTVRLYGLAAYFAVVALLSIFFEATRTEAGIALLVVVTCVLLSVLEVLPAWGMTLALWLLAPAALFRFGAEYAIWQVVAGSLHPVLVVFLAGFAFAGAAQKHDIDDRLTRAAVRIAGGDHAKLIALIAATTVWLSAWISNIAAAALMFGALRPLLREHRINHSQQRSLMLTIVIAANLGGMATPIGTGSNAVAIAELAPTIKIDFAEWMLFAVPLTIAMVVAMTVVAMRSLNPVRLHPAARRSVPRKRRIDMRTAVIFVATVLLWVFEPVHHVPAVWVALAATVLLVASRAIGWKELRELDWGTLLLIAGGIGIGNIMNRSGAAHALVQVIPIGADAPRLTLFLLCLLSASLAAVMSNTGTAALLIPIAVAVLPNPSTAILVALATSFGFPFVVSTPANAMAIRQGLPPTDLLRAGLLSIVVGCSVIALTGRFVLRLIGIP